MKRLILGFAVVVAVAVAVAGLASATPRSGTLKVDKLAGTSGDATVKVFVHEKYVINKSATEELGFTPGTVTVTSGSMLTFAMGNQNTDPHTLTIVPQAKLPRTADDIDQCATLLFSLCRQYGAPHLKNPKAPLGPSNPIAHFVLNKGQPGLDSVGDSIAIVPTPATYTITVPVSAPAGTTLYFICTLHPWMQGKIIVK
jgi:plastocyanin